MAISQQHGLLGKNDRNVMSRNQCAQTRCCCRNVSSLSSRDHSLLLMVQHTPSPVPSGYCSLNLPLIPNCPLLIWTAVGRAYMLDVSRSQPGCVGVPRWRATRSSACGVWAYCRSRGRSRIHVSHSGPRSLPRSSVSMGGLRFHLW